MRLMFDLPSRSGEEKVSKVKMRKKEKLFSFLFIIFKFHQSFHVNEMRRNLFQSNEQHSKKFYCENYVVEGEKLFFPSKWKKSLKFFDFLKDYFNLSESICPISHTTHSNHETNSGKLPSKYLLSSSFDNQRKHSQLLMSIKSITRDSCRHKDPKHNHLCVFDWL